MLSGKPYNIGFGTAAYNTIDNTDKLIAGFSGVLYIIITILPVGTGGFHYIYIYIYIYITSIANSACLVLACLVSVLQVRITEALDYYRSRTNYIGSMFIVTHTIRVNSYTGVITVMLLQSEPG